MRKIILGVLVISLGISVIGCTGMEKVSGQSDNTTAYSNKQQTKAAGAVEQEAVTATDPGQADKTDGSVRQVNSDKSNDSDKRAVAGLTEEFGRRLKLVSLLAPKETLDKSMEESYGGLVSPELIKLWQMDPQNAPGRLVSSPWPDSIEILEIDKTDDFSYEVKGNIIELTSNEVEHGGAAAKRPITLAVQKTGDHWLITAVTLGDYADNDSILYENQQCGFSFSLPVSWKGYSILADKWEGLAVDAQQGERVVESGPMLYIRHPGWTQQDPRQDIPIMVFTLNQWNSLQKDEFHIGAAPVGPTELGRNSAYVFALPARYNFAFPTGYKEVEDILNDHPLKPLEKMMGC